MFLLSRAEKAGAEQIRSESIRMPIVVEEPGGAKTYELEGLIVRPDDGEAHPLAVINHGSPRNQSDRATMSPYGMWAQAAAFAERGWTAVTFLRRGYGGSSGDWAESYGPCSNPDYLKAGRAGAEDIAAVAAFMHQRPFVTKGRWISVGTSAGGFATVALSANAAEGLAAAISFAPGRGSTDADSVCGETRLIEAFSTFGRTSRTPLLWVSAPNDHFFGPRLVEKALGAFSRAGGEATHVEAAPFGDDGHMLFSASGKDIWTPIVDRFLAANRLKLRAQPIALARPKVRPPARLGARGRKAFDAYLDAAPNKAFAVGPGSSFGWATGRGTPEKSRADAMSYCAGDGEPAQCHVVNVNDAPAR